VTVRARRRRAALLLALALSSGGIAASQVHGRAQAIEQQVGPLVPVLVTTENVAAGRRVPARALAVRQVPQRFAPPDALASAQQALGRRLGGPLAAGTYVTPGALDGGATGDEEGGPAPVSRGQRSLEVAVAGGESLTGAPPGARVDVLVTTDSRSGSGRTFLALQDVELLAVRDSGGDGASADGAARHSDAVATLRVTLRQAVYLTSAESFARELRLLVRAPGDRRSAGPLTVDGGRL
jgi:pilus assembly protein CpaB